MTKQEIEDLLASIYSKEEYEVLFKEAEKNFEIFNLVWELAKERPDKESWRLLWILDHATTKDSDFILPILDELYERVLKTNHHSYVRQGLKLILKCPIRENYASEMLERCIDWMNGSKSKIANQAYGLEFFYKICQLYPEMAPELITHINDILERNPSAGFKVRLLKIRDEFK